MSCDYCGVGETVYWFRYQCNVPYFFLVCFLFLVIPELREEMNRVCRSNVPGNKICVS